LISIDRPRPSAGAWVTVASAWVVGVAALLAWVLKTPAPVLREQLRIFQFWSLEACLILGLAVSAVVLRDLPRLLDRRDIFRLTVVTALALGLTVGVAPRTNRIYYDEQIYQNIGQNLADLKLAQMCNDGAVEHGRLRCSSGEYNKQPYAYPHVLSLAYRVFGVGTAAAFAVNAMAMGITVCFLYLLVVILFADRVAAFFAALLLALTPEQLVWSATASVEPSASLACVAALLAAACFVRSRSTASLVGAAVAAAYAVQFRPESFLIVPVVGVLMWQRAREEFTRPRLWWAGLLFLALAAIHVGHMVAVRNEGWGTTHERLSIGYVADNLRVNGWFFLADARFPVTYTLLAILGLSGRRAEAGRIAVALYFLLFFGIVLLFYAGSYDYGADIRYSLSTYPPLTILGGLGMARLARWIERVKPGLPALQGLMAAVAFQFLWYLPVVNTIADGAWASRADVEFARSLVPDLPGSSYVLTHNPGMFQVWGVNAGQMSLAASNPAYLEDLAARYTDGVYLHWNYWCNVQDPVQREFCTKILELSPGEPVREHRERDQHFILYRLKIPIREQ
jgi:Dolichyl-phosphate-mannose-protein mannosyltransferase